MKKIIITERQHRLIKKSILKEQNRDKYEDLFYFIENNPKKGTIASVFYTSPVSMNKFVMINGEKQINPMRGLIYKNSKINFRWEDTYKKAVERTNPEHEMGSRSGEFEKIQGYSILETGKNGLYLPVLPLGSENQGYSKMSESGSLEPINIDEVKPYFRPYKSYGSKSGVNFRLLLVDRISKIKAGGSDWGNPHFVYK